MPGLGGSTSSTDLQQPKHERVLERRVIEPLEGAGLAAVPGSYVDAEKERMLVGLGGAQLGDPLCRLVVLHPRRPPAVGHQDPRIVAAPQVVVRRVPEQVVFAS